jgi:hypothetical protein
MTRDMTDMSVEGQASVALDIVEFSKSIMSRSAQFGPECSDFSGMDEADAKGHELTKSREVWYGYEVTRWNCSRCRCVGYQAPSLPAAGLHGTTGLLGTKLLCHEIIIKKIIE